MRLISYLREGLTRHGRLEAEDRVTELGDGDLLGLLAAGLDASTASGEGPSYPLSELELLAPLANPPKLLAVAANYQEHVVEGGGEPLDKSRLAPRLFLKPATSIIGPDQAVGRPDWTSELDWEAELAVFIGRGGKNLTVETALDHVAGYSCANDVSARSVDHGFERDTDAAVNYFDWLAGKWGDGFAPLGPWLVTADEIADPQNLAVRLDVNGERRQDGSTADMIFTVAELVSYASKLSTLQPGDIILTGTPSGVGAASGTFLEPGDRMTVAIEGLGELTTSVSEPSEGSVPAPLR